MIQNRQPLSVFKIQCLFCILYSEYKKFQVIFLILCFLCLGKIVSYLSNRFLIIYITALFLFDTETPTYIPISGSEKILFLKCGSE